jgi:hypothetical protein
VERAALAGDDVEIDGRLRDEMLDVVGLFEIDGELNGQPTIGRTFVDIDVHL